MSSEKFTFMDYTIAGLYDLKKAIEKNKDILFFKTKDGNDIYLTASLRGHLDIMKYLEKEYNWNINIRNIYDSDAYIYASYGGNLDIMKYLEKEHKWDFNTMNMHGKNAYNIAIDEQFQHIINHFRENSLIEDKVTNIISNCIQKYEKQLSEKDKNIKDLEEKLVAIMGIIQ